MTTQSISGERKTFAASQECWPNVPDRAARDVFNDRKDETRRYKPFFSIVMFFALTAASLAQQVKTDYDHNANFSQYKTYSWEKAQTRDPLFVHRIKDAVNGAVPVKGWTQVDSGGDVSIAAIEIAQNKQDLNTIYDGLGGRFGGFGDATTTTETYKVGDLVVNPFDAKTKNLIWRDSSSDTLSNNADKNTKSLDKGVQKMFAHFPQQTKQ